MSMQAKPKAYVPCCVPPSPHPHADMTDPHGDGGHVGGAELPDAGPEASRCTVCKHARSPRGTDLSRGSLRPARQRRKPQGAAEAQRTPASATPREPTQRRRTPEHARHLRSARPRGVGASTTRRSQPSSTYPHRTLRLGRQSVAHLQVQRLSRASASCQHAPLRS